MSAYTIRVELHGAVSGDYERLHSAMEAAGCNRWIDGFTSNGEAGRWILPTAEYNYESTMALDSVRDSFKIIADSIVFGAWVFITESVGRAWSTRQV